MREKKISWQLISSTYLVISLDHASMRNSKFKVQNYKIARKICEFACVVVEIGQVVLVCLLILGGNYTAPDNLNITN